MSRAREWGIGEGGWRCWEGVGDNSLPGLGGCEGVLVTEWLELVQGVDLNLLELCASFILQVGRLWRWACDGSLVSRLTAGTLNFVVVGISSTPAIVGSLLGYTVRQMMRVLSFIPSLHEPYLLITIASRSHILRIIFAHKTNEAA